jgi:energy-coupling factor transporter ATP-binding protein EcfA2
MRLRSIDATNIPPVKKFQVDNLSDVIVLAGPNGVGKTKLVEGLLQFFQGPNQNPQIKLIIEATNDKEREDWSQSVLDMSVHEDTQKLLRTLQKGRRRNNWESSILNFDSDRSIQPINLYTPTWDLDDPWEEVLGWNFSFRRLRDRFQDTLHSIFRKVRSRREDIALKVEELIKEKDQIPSSVQPDGPDPEVKINPQDFPDPIAPFKVAFSQLLAPKELLDAEPKSQQLFYKLDDQTLPITSLSSGEREVVNIVFDFILRKPNDCIIIFDEPELHLHPELSYKLLQTLRGIGSNNQFIFCTHSPEIITASLDSSVVFIAPPKSPETNQAIVVREDDQTHQALKLLGQSIGIISLGKKIVLIEGSQSSLDKQAYGTILKNRFPNLVLVPGGGKGVLTSFASLHREVLERTIWGVEFFMLCDRDAVPPSRSGEELEQASSGRLRVLKKYHLENYFLSEEVIAKIFSGMELEGSWLTSPKEIREELKKIARELISYTAALTASAYFRETVGNLDIMPSDCHGKSADVLVQQVTARVRSEKARIEGIIDQEKIETYVREIISSLEKSLDADTDDWKDLTPGKQLLNIFASKAKLDVGRLKILYLREAEKTDPYPFQDIVNIFDGFNSYSPDSSDDVSNRAANLVP